MEGRQGGDRKSRDKILPLEQTKVDSSPKKTTIILDREPKGKSADIAAKAVGINRETYRQAKAVVNSGNQEEIQAKDSGEKSINAAVAVGRGLT